MDIRLELEEQWEEDGKKFKQFAVLDGENFSLGKALTSETHGRRTLEYVDDYILPKFLIQATNFSDAAEESESLAKMFRRYEKLEREGVLVVSSSSDSSRIEVEIAPVDGGESFTTDEELRQLVLDKCRLVHDD